MVFILDGCSFNYAHTWSKSDISICWRHYTALCNMQPPPHYRWRGLRSNLYRYSPYPGESLVMTSNIEPIRAAAVRVSLPHSSVLSWAREVIHIHFYGVRWSSHCTGRLRVLGTRLPYILPCSLLFPRKYTYWTELRFGKPRLNSNNTLHLVIKSMSNVWKILTICTYWMTI